MAGDTDDRTPGDVAGDAGDGARSAWRQRFDGWPRWARFVGWLFAWPLLSADATRRRWAGNAQVDKYAMRLGAGGTALWLLVAALSGGTEPADPPSGTPAAADADPAGRDEPAPTGGSSPSDGATAVPTPSPTGDREPSRSPADESPSSSSSPSPPPSASRSAAPSAAPSPSPSAAPSASSAPPPPPPSPSPSPAPPPPPPSPSPSPSPPPAPTHTETEQPSAGHTGKTDGGWDCEPAYQECLPSSRADMNCGDIGHQVNLKGTSDPWDLDSDSDGYGCESSSHWSSSKTYPYY